MNVESFILCLRIHGNFVLSIIGNNENLEKKAVKIKMKQSDSFPSLISQKRKKKWMDLLWGRISERRINHSRKMSHLQIYQRIGLLNSKYFCIQYVRFSDAIVHISNSKFLKVQNLQNCKGKKYYNLTDN